MESQSSSGDLPMSPPAGRARVLARGLLRVAIVAAVIIGIVMMVRGLAVEQLAAAFQNARVWPVIVASAIAVGVCALKAASWRIMLAPRFRVPLPRLVRYTLVAFATSAIAPARAGEVVRVWLLKRRDGVDAATSIAVATSEKALDVLALLALAAPLPWLLPLPAWVAHGMLGIVAIAAIAVLVAIVASTRVRADSWISRFLGALERRPRELVLCFVLLLINWVAELVAVMLVMYALDISVPWPGALLVLFVVNVAISIPSTPAQLGTLELGALIPLVDILGVAKEPAVAFALLYHATQILPILVIGIVLELRLVLGCGSNDPVRETASRGASDHVRDTAVFRGAAGSCR